MGSQQPFFCVADWQTPLSPTYLAPPPVLHSNSPRRNPARSGGLFASLASLIGGVTEPKPDWQSVQNGTDEAQRERVTTSLGRVVQSYDPAEGPHVCLFGFEVPELPEAISGGAVTAEELPDKIAEVLHMWTHVVRELHVWQRAGFSLRFVTDPECGRIRISVLCRISGEADRAMRSAQALAVKIPELLQRSSIRSRVLDSEAELRSFLDPLPKGAIAEVRQFDCLLELNEYGTRTDNYAVSFFARTHDAWLQVFESLVRQPAPVVVNLHLEPTEPWPIEMPFFAQAADYAKQLERIDIRASRISMQEHSINAAKIYSLYNLLQTRLQQPYLGVVQIIGADVLTSGTVAALFEAALTGYSGRENNAPDTLPTRAVHCIPRSPDDLLAARCTLTQLTLTDWLGQGRPLPRLACQRLRYLLDADTAAAMFRFPVSTGRGIAGVRTYRPRVGYERGERATVKPADHILLGATPDGGVISVPIRSLTRHMLIAGIPGSGKTNTSLSILAQLWRDHKIPFLAIEPVKQEYRGLASLPGFESLRVFTLGDERTSPFRINPLELLPDVTVEEHVSGLMACFRAAMPQDGPLPLLLEESVRNAYKQNGWRFCDVRLQSDPRQFPTLRDVHREAMRAVEHKNYSSEIRQNLMGALKTRIGSLLLGAKGRMFNCERGLPIEEWMSVPTVVELDRIRDPDQKTLPILFLILALREFARSRSRNAAGLTHITLIEEAHNVMSAPIARESSASADTSGQAAKDIGNMLHEMRGLGEGVIVAEQTPTLLHRAAIDLTMTKVVHRLSSPGESEVLGRAMVLPDRGTVLQNLRTGEAAMFAEGLEGAVFLMAPNFKDSGEGFTDVLPDFRIREHMTQFVGRNRDFILPFDGCRFCTRKCKHQERVAAVVVAPSIRSQLTDALKAASQEQKSEANEAVQLHNYFRLASGVMRAAGPTNPDVAWCVICHTLDEDYMVPQWLSRRFVEFWAGEKSQ